MDKTPFSKVQIRFQDCDPFNHLNNAKYIDYFMNTREDQLQHFYNFDILAEMNNKGLVWIVSSHQICYLRPAVMQETVLIESQLINFTSKTLLLEMRMFNEAKTQIKSLIWSTFVHYHIPSGKSVSHSKEQNVFFNELLLPISQPSFEERRAYLQRQ